MYKRLISLFTFLLLLSGLSGCGYNSLQSEDEAVKAAWSEVVNQYQRRADLVPNLVKTVQGYANQEKTVLTEVTQARASVGKIQVTPDMVNDPAAMQKYNEAQGQLTNALSRLLVVSENYPNLKSDALFRDLTSQLEGTENRIQVARQKFNLTAKTYNTSIRRFPTNILAGMFGFESKAYFEAEAGADKAPKVEF